MDLRHPLPIPVSQPIDGFIRIPGSKSLTNRAILIASLAKGKSCLKGVLHSDDTHYMTQAFKNLGTQIVDQAGDLFIEGCSGKLKSYDQEIYIGNAGTAARFLTALLPLGQGTYVLNGNERMQLRPITDLLESLQDLGAQVADINQTGCPPIQIVARGLKGGSIQIPGDRSSQYVSAIMMAAPYASTDTTIHITGELVSKTYVEMTQKIMTNFGVHCQWPDDKTIIIPGGQQYQGLEYEIEGDASSASYFFGMAAITQGKIRVSGLTPESTQGDLGLLGILQQMGCTVSWQNKKVTVEGKALKAVDVDMNTMSDVAPTLAVISLFAEGVTRIHNVANMRIKECDRISATVTELKKLGAIVEEWEDGFSIQGQGSFKGAELATYDDHRMAMSFSLAGLKIPGVIIQEPACVSKTFPSYFEQFLPLVQA